MFVFPINAFGSENSHATFKVENVESNDYLNGKITESLPSTNEITNSFLIILGVLLLLLFIILVKRNKTIINN